MCPLLFPASGMVQSGWPAGKGSIALVQDLFRGDFGENIPDLVCFRHVLENCDEPADFLRGLRRALCAASDSVIYCEVPNAEAVFGGASLWDLIYPHVCYFSAPALQRLFANNGFRTLAIGTGPYPEDAIRLVDLENGKEWLVLHPVDQGPRALVFSPDGSRLFTGFDRGSGMVWDVRRREGRPETN